ncbi:hypothetical protein IGS67_04420 [Flavimobilis sp. GY10621]|uniref:Lipoprotein n=1 Tax=Flavimobilis rhizosphaerae TaxID=2775421 RepID=A0ABR9DR08_9MICO|nr:hypothetical protein [Flavimobilis rhizosphaerae]MBD9698742.1 hypothetical protein [Flavimobilis rhizosphaerae]
MQIDPPEKTAISLSSLARRRTAALVVALSACAGALTLAACGDERPAPPPSNIAPSAVAPGSDAPSKASRDGGDGRGEAADESAEPTEEPADPFEDGGGLVRGLGPRGHDAR